MIWTVDIRDGLVSWREKVELSWLRLAVEVVKVSSKQWLVGGLPCLSAVPGNAADNRH